jgi:hypothetical protein
MKPTSTLKKWSLRSIVCSLLILSFAGLPRPATAQTPVTNVFAHWANATVSTTYSGTGATGNAGSGLTGNTYNYAFGPVVTTPNTYLLDSFTAVGLNYRFVAPTSVVKFRRVDNASVTGLRKSLWFEQSSNTTVGAGGTVQLLPAYDDSLERIFSSGQVFNIGIDNDFENSTNTNNNNIERVDQIIPAGVSATDGTKAGFVVFDRGNGGTHDAFYIAAIKTLDASGNPSAYYNAVSVVAGNYGFDVSALMNYITLRKNPADSRLLMMNNSAQQYRDGVFLRFSDLGVANGTKIYGYSLFGTDVNITSAANLVDYTNATNFPTNSDYSLGGIDQVAVTGLWVTNTSYVTLADRVSSFSADAVSGKVQISWTLGETDGLKELVVERSPDGVSFSPLMELEAPLAGQQTVFDEQPLAGQDYYRLRLVDEQGDAAAYSTVSRVSFGSGVAGVSFRVYPNPVVRRVFSFEWRGLPADTYTLQLLDMSGRRVAEQTQTGGSAFSGTMMLPTRIPAGMYHLRLLDRAGKGVAVTSVECY